MCLCCSLTLQHIPVSCPTGWACLFLAGHPSCPWLPGPSSFLGSTFLLLVQLSCPWIPGIFLFLSFCSAACQVLLPRALCCCSWTWCPCGVPFLLLPALPCPGYWKERATCACHAFHVQVLNDQETDLDSLSKKFTIIFWTCLLTPLFFSKEKQIILHLKQRSVSNLSSGPLFTISLKSTQMNCLEKGRSWQSTQGPAGWAVKWEVMLPPCCSASADVGTCTKWERLPALGLVSEPAAGLLVSLQGHEMCVSVHFQLVWGLSPNFKSVLKSVNLRFRAEAHGVARAVWWQQCFLASGHCRLELWPPISWCD